MYRRIKTIKDRIVHLTSVHPRYDIRIFEKECKSLLKHYEVQLVVADGLGDEIKDGINITDVGKEKNRIGRIFISTWKIYNSIKRINTNVFHLHDPELIPLGLLLKISGKKIIFDIHEDIYEQIKIKNWIPSIVMLFLLPAIKIINKVITYNFNLILAEISYLKNYSKRRNKYRINILNYPQNDILEPYINNNRNQNGLFYIGSITYHRGLYIILDALLILKKNNIDFNMYFIGDLHEEIDWKYYHAIRNKIKFYGYLDIRNGYEISKKCKAGLAVLKPVGNYVESIPTKIFEYMSVKLPFIASDFTAWRELFSKDKCGIFINPQNQIELANAMVKLLNNNTLVTTMGNNGRKAVEHKYNWYSEEKKLLALYKNILSY